MRRLAIVSICGLVAALLAMYLPVAAFLPSVSPVAFAGGERIPASTVTPLPEFVRTQVVDIEYEANGTAGSSGVFWTELYYRIPGGDWKIYDPPWNPDGRWFGQLGFAGGLIRGTIPFDTYYTGGEATYEFYTVGVDRGYKLEDAPRDHAKARTTLDTRPPNLFVGKPSPDAWTRDDTLTWRATDAVSGLQAIEAVLDTRDPMPFAVEIGGKEASGSKDLSLRLEDEGDHDLLVRAWDRAGNEAVVFERFHFDPKAPTLEITSPERDRWVGTKDVEVRWTALDSASGIASVRLIVSGRDPVDLAGGVDRHTFLGLDEQTHTVSIAAFDAAGNFASESVTFGVDVSAPTLQLIAPEDETFSKERDLDVIWFGSDAVSGIDHFELSFAGKTSGPIRSTARFTFAGVAEGPGTVQVVALDRAGNRVEVRADVEVDYTAPVVSVTRPAEGSTVYGNVDLGWTVTETGSGLKQIQVIFDDRAVFDATGTTTHRLDRAPGIGAHFVRIRASDMAGNVGEAMVAYSYGGAAPPSQSPLAIPSLEFWLLMVLIGAIAVGSAYYAVRRRKRSQA